MRARLVHCTRLLFVLAGGVSMTGVAAAQETARAPFATPFATWQVFVSAGAIAEPVSNGGAGGALALDIARRLRSSRVSLAALVAAGRNSDLGPFGSAQLMYDRDWRFAAVGIEATAKSAARADLAFGIYGGAVWSRSRPVGPGEPTPTWDEGAVLIPTMRAAYRIGGPFAVSARLAVLQRVGQDNFIGDVGGLLTAGAVIAW